MGLPQVTIFKLCSPTELLDLQILLEIGLPSPVVPPVVSVMEEQWKASRLSRAFPAHAPLGTPALPSS